MKVTNFEEKVPKGGRMHIWQLKMQELPDRPPLDQILDPLLNNKYSFYVQLPNIFTIVLWVANHNLRCLFCTRINIYLRKVCIEIP